MPPIVESVSYWPFAVLAISMVFVVVSIAVFRVHAFIALMIAAMLVGVLSKELPGAEDKPHIVRAVEQPMEQFGVMAGKIAWVIGLASIIGICLMDSGSADKIVRVMIGLLGEQRAAWALLICGFVIGIPVFFDTVFFLLIPLAQALSLRLGKNYVMYVAAIASGAVITHSIVPPTPGPLTMVETLGLNLGSSILVGVGAGLLPAIVALMVGKYLNAAMPIAVRETPGISLDELRKVSEKPDHELPSFLVAILPVVLPVFLIALVSIGSAMGGKESMGDVFTVIEILGNKFVAMFLGAVIALVVLARQKGMSLQSVGDVMGPPLSTAGVIILITAAGGAFGAMLKASGIGDSIRLLAGESGINLIFLAWLVAAVMKVAQGSGTVSMITTSAMMAGIIGDGSNLAYSPMWIYLSIGFGSMMFSWMNDSGFWVVGKLSGFSERETLKTWTLILAVISVVGLLEVLVLSSIVGKPF